MKSDNKHVAGISASDIIRCFFFALLLLSIVGCPTASEKTAETRPPLTYDGVLLISEVGSCPYINSSGWIEVYNYTSSPADLGKFKLRTYARKKIDPYSFENIATFDLPTLVIQPGTYAVIRGKISDSEVNGSQVVYIDSTDLVPNWVNDNKTSGSGFVELTKGNSSIDYVSFGLNSDLPLEDLAWIGNSNAPTLPEGNDEVFGTSIARNASLDDTNTAVDWTFCGFSTAGGPNDIGSESDNDGDGIPDSCEMPGTTFAGLPLYDWGARTNQKDIFIHIDHMNDADPACTPRKEALEKVRSAFLSHAIFIHFDTGNLFGKTSDDYNLDGKSHTVPFALSMSLGYFKGKTNFYDYKNKYMDIAKKQIFHYLLMAFSQNEDGSAGSSGIAEIKGNDIMITLGNWGLNSSTAEETNRLINCQAGTIMHELGHNLGLRHGGDVNDNYKPNYVSIMNYMYQIQGLPTIGNNEGDRYYYFRKYNVKDSIFEKFLPNGLKDLTNNRYQSSFVIDYSDGSGLSSGNIDENNILESLGLKRSGSLGVDFNGDGDLSDMVNMDLNNDSKFDKLGDYDDWNNLFFFFQRTWNGDADGILKSRIVSDPVSDDRQEVIEETITDDMLN
jgi:hypothetical protein